MADGFSLVFEPLFQAGGRDWVVMDQRGTGLSDPSLACPQGNELLFETLNQDLDSETLIEMDLAATQECHQTWIDRGVNLDAYNSVQNAADFEALRLALGYEQVNLYGISYGTRLALTYERDYPAAVRSLLLDSSYPLEVDLFASGATHFDRALQTLFQTCAADADCAATYPDLEGVLFQSLKTLDAAPVTVEAVSLTTGDSYTVLMTDERWMGFLFSALYQSGWLPYLPEWIFAAAEGNFSRIAPFYVALLEFNADINMGMYMSVQCHEEVPFASQPPPPSPNTERLLPYLSLNAPEALAASCRIWNPAPTAGPLENVAVGSQRPALILNGDFDPITPPEWGAQVAAQFPNSQAWVLPNGGHGVSVEGPCVAAIIGHFWETLAHDYDSSCLAEAAIRFSLPGQAPVLNLIPFQDEVQGVTGVYPEGWLEAAPGIYARDGLSNVSYAYFSFPNVGLDLVQESLLSQLGGDEEVTLTPLDPVQIGETAWQISEVRFMGQGLYLALGEKGDNILIVLIQAPPDELGLWYEALLLPVLEAIRPLD
jgi:pimeloyl-ACP methyl ester carboxylesterase